MGQDHLETAISQLRPTVAEWIANLLDHYEIQQPPTTESWANTALAKVIKLSDQFLSTTGLVFAGYGDHEYFPAMTEYTHSGVITGKHILKKKSAEKIDHDQPAWISGFAQTSMTDTFSLGLSFDVYRSLMGAVVDTLEHFVAEVTDKSGGQLDLITDIDEMLLSAKNKISDAVLDKARKEHSLPLRSVLSVLPVDEMAELAETLITLQSLKEKVTKPSETVGGPVDVAIITKHEGLIWVKRKHFFNPDINGRFQLRQAAAHSRSGE